MTARWRPFADVCADPALRAFGAALALINVLTAVFWLTVQPIASILDRGTEPICWPFFEACGQFRALDAGTITALVTALAMSAVLNALLFISRRTCRAGCAGLVLVTGLKVLLLLQDYRLVLNQHYMAVAVTAAFLVVPARRRVLQYLIVSFYVWAGALKVNADWLSGGALGGNRPFGMPESWLPYACAYVVALELVVVWGLFSTRAVFFWAALVQLFVFHVSSFWVVGFFYPILMFLILSIFVFDRFIPPPGRVAPPPSVRSFWSGREHPALYAFIVGFSTLQLLPRALSSDAAMTGEGRIFALNMFDAPIECRATITRHRPGYDDAVRALRVPYLQPRIGCDPVVYLEAARNACRAVAHEPSIDMDLRLRAWRAGHPPGPTIDLVDLRSFCRSDVRYVLFQHNAWIRDPKEVVGSSARAGSPR